MTRRHTLYINAAALAVLLGAGCTADPGAETGGEGSVRFRIETSDAATRAYDPMEALLVRIYKADGGLIRRYTSLDEMPEQLYLVEGEYDVQVEAGTGNAATWEEKSYSGRERFSVTARQSNSVEVKCPSINTGVEVVFDPGVIERYDRKLEVEVRASEHFDEAAADTPALCFDAATEGLTGYFILPEGVSGLSWRLSAEGSESGTTERSGVITGARAATVYRLTFRYSQTPDGSLGITVDVDDTAEEYDDRFLFSPQPGFHGDGFDMNGTVGYVAGGDLRFSVTSALELATVVMTTEKGERHTLYDASGAIPAPEWATSVRQEDGSIAISLGEALFTPLAAGLHDWQFEATDTENGTGRAELHVAVPGLLQTEAGDCDLWNNTATLRAVVTDPAAEEVIFSYRSGDRAWQQAAGQRQEDGYTWSAVAEPRWVAGSNDRNTTYRLDPAAGIFADRTYEYKVSVNGSESAPLGFETAAGPAIPDGDMENGSLPCFSKDGSASTFWASGNNTFTSSLCTQSTYAGAENSYCAKLSSTATMGILAAGNLFTGIFYKDGLTTGVVEFGQPYDWTARPSALHVKYYAETLGKVDIDKKYGAPLKSGDQDRARIFVAIVDWSARHRVTSGASAPTGMWDPTSGPDSAGEGAVIAYGSCFIKAPSEGESMIDIELPLEFYDRTAKPSGTYTLVISCAASAYGDYMTGCSSNVLYLDDFRWIF